MFELCIVCNEYFIINARRVEEVIFNYILNLDEFYVEPQLTFLSLVKKSPDIFCGRCIILGLNHCENDTNMYINRIKILLKKYIKN